MAGIDLEIAMTVHLAGAGLVRAVLQRMGAIDIGDVRGVSNAEEARHAGEGPHHQFDPVDGAAHGTGRLHLRGGHYFQRFPVPGMGGVQIDQLADALGRAIGDTGDHHPAIAVPDQDDILQPLERHQRHDVLDMRVEVDVGVQQMGALAKARQRRAMDLMPRRAQPPGDLLIAPAAMPPAMYQHECRHARSLLLSIDPSFVIYCGS
ncbi:hypothetical protein LTR94_002338 [Friedmanniomyces endolithicus]|nr:hypothetical protein LTR94_002338 [Friedmanniomyces endolithicus]